MENKFIEPSSAAKKSSSTKKSFVYSSYEGDRIISPYDGEVVSTSDTECDGNIRIKHNFNNKTIYSNFCGVGRSNVLSGQKVYQSKSIGSFGKGDLKFEVIDRSGTKQDIISLLKNEVEKKPDKGQTKKSDFKYSTGLYDPTGKLNVVDLLGDVASLPKIGIEKILQSAQIKKKPKPEEEPNDIVFEEVKRIKQLMK